MEYLKGRVPVIGIRYFLLHYLRKLYTCRYPYLPVPIRMHRYQYRYLQKSSRHCLKSVLWSGSHGFALIWIYFLDPSVRECRSGSRNNKIAQSLQITLIPNFSKCPSRNNYKLKVSQRWEINFWRLGWAWSLMVRIRIRIDPHWRLSFLNPDPLQFTILLFTGGGPWYACIHNSFSSWIRICI